jgi:hypothetical protein
MAAIMTLKPSVATANGRKAFTIPPETSVALPIIGLAGLNKS